MTSVEITTSDLRLLLMMSLRYSFGRRSYLPKMITRIIKANGSIFFSSDWKLMHDEILNAEALGHIDDDDKEWQELKDYTRTMSTFHLVSNGY